MGTLGVLGAVAALVAAGLLRWLPVKARGRGEDLSPVAVAGLRGGTAAALGVALVELHLAGTVEVVRHGRLLRVGHKGPGPGLTPLHRALWAAFGRALSPLDAGNSPAARRARAELFAELTARGLRCGRARLLLAALAALAACGLGVAVAVGGDLAVGLPPAVLPLAVLAAPARTLAGRRVLRGLRRRNPPPGAAEAVHSSDVALLVALYGRPALKRLVPELADRTALLGGRSLSETVAGENRARNDFGGVTGGSYPGGGM
ncbi:MULTISPECIES: TIGR04222 domain-containing membrane protein [Kitasatospora]|nr:MULTISPECIES: TIGR04222 domain-containing membrane protein [Kitasatospora]